MPTEVKNRIAELNETLDKQTREVELLRDEIRRLTSLD